MTTILTLRVDPASQRRFEALRRAHYPAALNKIAAHLTLFHTLPATEEVRLLLLAEAESLAGFSLQVNDVRSLGRGVAYFLESPDLMALHGRLARALARDLSAQDRQGFRPHVVVQNKASGPEAKILLADLSASFVPWQVEATGLCWWDYLGGPWALREEFAFAVSLPSSPT